MEKAESFETAYFGGGCFWCTEAVFQRLKGIEKVVSGYAGGTKENPTYEEVSSGKTGYIETIEVTFDPGIISYVTLLTIFWATHDPTSQDRQGADVGTQYRSVIFYTTDEQKKQAEVSKKQIQPNYPSPIVTEILPKKIFYSAENYHQDYYNSNRFAPYCQVVIDPKVKKLLKEFTKEVKEEYLQHE